MKKSTITITTLMIITLIAGSAFAWGPGKNMKNGGGNYYQDCPRYNGQGQAADLTAEQKDALRNLRQEFIDNTYELRTLKMQKHNELRMLVQTSNPDKGKIENLATEISDLQRQLMIKNIDFKLAAKKIAPELEFGFGGGRGMGHHGKGFGNRGNGNCSGWNTLPEE